VRRVQLQFGLQIPKSIRVASLWLSSPLNRQRLRGARAQVCVFAIAHHPEPSILMVRSMFGDDWMPPQEGIMLEESVEEAAWRCLDEEVEICVDDPSRRRNVATLRNTHFLGRLALPEERHGERPIADDIGDGPLGVIPMKAKAYWAAILVFRSQYDVSAAANRREVDAVEWCSFEEARHRIDGTVRKEKAAVLHEGLDHAERSLPTRPPRITWHPQDFIVGGRYCDSHHIVDELEDLRQARGAKALVLLALRETTVFRPLLRLAHADHGRLQELQEILVNRADLTSIARSGAPRENLKQSLLEALPLDELGLSGIDATLLERLEQPPPHPAGDPRPPLTRPASVVVLAFGGKSSKSEQSALDALLLMVNASAPVIAHRELQAQTDLRRALAEAEVAWHREPSRPAPPLGSRNEEAHDPEDENEWHPDNYAKRLLQLALDVTHSSVGNLYVARRDGRSLKLITQQPDDAAIEVLGPTVEGEPSSVVQRVYARGRALIINDVVDYQRMNPNAKYLSVIEDPSLEPYAELAVPIVQGPFASSVPPRGIPPPAKPIGVLNVERVRPTDTRAGDFTASDLAALQTIAFLYALRRAGSLTMASASSLARLTQQNALAPASDALALLDEPDIAGVPVDLMSARKSLSLITGRIYGLTRSSSVAIRVVTPDQCHLVRFVAFPRERLRDEHSVIPISARDSVNAWVARTGLPCYIPNVPDRWGTQFDGLDGVLKVANRRTLRSELCLPIAVQGRVLGTLNLESAQSSDYPDDVSAVVQAMAEQAGVAIAQARRADEWRLFAIHAEQTRRSHLVLKKVGKFNEWLEKRDYKLSQNGAKEARKRAEAISKAADPLRRAATAGATLSGSPKSAREAVEEALTRSRIGEEHLDIRDLPPADLTLPELSSHVLTIALTEVLQNAANHVSTKTNLPFMVRVRYRSAMRGALEYLCIEVTSRVEEALESKTVDLLYRRPVAQDRTHLGAYVAGSYVRSVGGEVYVAENGPKYFTAALELPVKPAALTLDTTEKEADR
jgi:putative (di)nucleoside polyphosphate hydrolase